MDESPQPIPIQRRSKSDILRTASLQEYIVAESKPNGNGWKGFLRSNLFTALVIWMLGQAVFAAGIVVSFYYKTSNLLEWKGQVEADRKRMDEQGTVHSHYELEKHVGRITALEVKVDKLEEKTSHIEVLESEHRRLTRDVEELRNGKK